MCAAEKKVYEVTADGLGLPYDGPDLDHEAGWFITFDNFNEVVKYAKEQGMEAVKVTYACPDPLYLDI